jgi:hypothetical protein
MKGFIRKIAAVGASIAMLGMTVGGAVALDLSDLDTGAPFIANGAYANTAFVVGMTAGTNDDAARLKLTNYFDNFVTASSDHTYNEDYDEDDDITLNGVDNLAGFGEVDSGMIDTLFEGEIEVNDTDYTAREIVNFSTTTNISTSYKGGQEEFGKNPYLAYESNSIKYGYAFTDAVPLYQVSTDETLDLTFLGEGIEVKTISATANTVTLEVTNTVSLDAGQNTEYKGHTVTLVRVYSASAAINVDGEEKIVAVGSTTDFGDDLTIEVDTVGEATNDPTLSSAVLKLSEQGVASTVADGNAFELFTDYATNSHSPWVWDIVANTTHLLYLGVDNRWTSDDLEPSQDYKTLPITVGESVVFPNNYAAVVFDSLTTETYGDFVITLEDSKDLSDEDDSSISVDNKAMVIFSSSDGAYFELSGADYDKVYLVNNATIYTGAAAPIFQFWGEDDDGDHYTTATSFVINYNDDDKDITIANDTSTNYTTNIKIDANDWDLIFPWNYSTDYYGAEEGVDEATDLIETTTNIGTKEHDVLLQDGTIVINPDLKFGSDKINLLIPDQDVFATFRVYTVASSSEVEAVLKADSAATGYDNLVLVGGPCVNSLTADYLGVTYPACESDSTIPEEQAIVKLVGKDDTVALIVAGWEKENTLSAAAKVVAGGLTGDSFIVTE